MHQPLAAALKYVLHSNGLYLEQFELYAAEQYVITV